MARTKVCGYGVLKESPLMETEPMKPEERFVATDINIVPTLRDAAAAPGLKLDKLTVAAPVNKNQWAGQDRRIIMVSAAESVVKWRVNSLSDLFCGDVQPPPQIDRFPPEYVPLFLKIRVTYRRFR
jgi:hypothetical protein